MTRAETLAAMKEALALRQVGNRAQTHWDGCVTEHHHRDCAIAWLLQEIEYLNAQLNILTTGLDVIEARVFELDSLSRKP